MPSYNTDLPDLVSMANAVNTDDLTRLETLLKSYDFPLRRIDSPEGRNLVKTALERRNPLVLDMIVDALLQGGSEDCNAALKNITKALMNQHADIVKEEHEAPLHDTAVVVPSEQGEWREVCCIWDGDGWQ